METKHIPKLSFKRGKRERGLGGVGNPHAPTDIKADKRVVGHIQPPTWRTKDNLWRILLTILKNEEDLKDPKNNPNCPWKWVTLKAKFDDEAGCRSYLEENWSKLAADLKLHSID